MSLEKTLDAVTEADLRELIQNQIPESRTLDYKLTLPDGTDDGFPLLDLIRSIHTALLFIGSEKSPRSYHVLGWRAVALKSQISTIFRTSSPSEDPSQSADQ